MVRGWGLGVGYQQSAVVGDLWHQVDLLPLTTAAEPNVIRAEGTPAPSP
jgi:hypothetical protein